MSTPYDQLRHINPRDAMGIGIHGGYLADQPRRLSPERFTLAACIVMAFIGGVIVLCTVGTYLSWHVWPKGTPGIIVAAIIGVVMFYVGAMCALFFWAIDR